jgi:hypothetical protein
MHYLLRQKVRWSDHIDGCRIELLEPVPERISGIFNQCREVLKYEIDRYNNHQVHSTTKEIPSVRFNQALNENRSLFRTFFVPPPYKSTKDIFCLRANRVVNPYHKISFSKIEIKVDGAHIRDTVDLRIVPDKDTGIAEIRMWCNNKFIGTYTVKNEDLNLVHF